MENKDFSTLSPAQQREALSNYAQQMAAASILEHAEMLKQSLTDKCTKKCISKPGSSLDSSEQKCLAFCVDRFLETYSMVGKAYQERLQKES